jgi:hypothetical protein
MSQIPDPTAPQENNGVPSSRQAGVLDAMRLAAAQLGHPEQWGTQRDLRFNEKTLRARQDIPSHWVWFLKPSGTHLLNLDLQWEREHVHVLLDAFANDLARPDSGAHLFLLDTGAQRMIEVSANDLAHVLDSFAPRFRVEGDAFLVGNKMVAEFAIQDKTRMTAIVSQQALTPEMASLLHEAGQYWAERAGIPTITRVDICPQATDAPDHTPDSPLQTSSATTGSSWTAWPTP